MSNNLPVEHGFAEIPGTRKIVMPNTAHVPNMEQPEAFNQLMLDFLASLR